MEKVGVMIDAGFLSKVSYKLGEGPHFKFIVRTPDIKNYLLGKKKKLILMKSKNN